MNDVIPHSAIRRVWNYMQLHQTPRNADVLIVLGSIDDRVARHAANLANTYSYKYVVITGGRVGRNTRQAAWEEATEAEHFATIFNAYRRNRQVLLETKAQHTGQNAVLSAEIIQKAGFLLPKTAMLVMKPYMERRAVGTFQAQWPEKATEFFVSSAPRELSEYCTKEYSIMETSRIMLKDFLNMQKYAELGLQTPVKVPSVVQQAAVEIKTWLHN